MYNLKSPWRAVASMFMLNGALFGVWASRIPAVSSAHELTQSSLGLLLLCMAAGAILAFPLAGHASDRLGCAVVTRRVAFFYAITLVLIGLSPNVWMLALALFAFGAAHGAMDVAMNAWAAEVERKAECSMMSSFPAMFSVGAGMGAVTGFVAASYYLTVSFHFTLVAILLTALALFIAQIPWNSVKVAGHQAGLKFSFPKGRLLAVGFVAFCASLGEGGVADWSALFLVSVAAVSESKAALGYAVFSLAMVTMRLIGDRIVAKLGPLFTARFGGAVAMAGSLMAIIWGTYPMSLLGFALMGIGYSVIMPLAFSRAANDETMSPGAAIASVSTLGYGGILLGPPLIGFVADASSLSAAFLIISILAGFIAILAGVLSVKGQTG